MAKLNMAETVKGMIGPSGLLIENYINCSSLSHYQLKQQTTLDDRKLWTILKYCDKCYFAPVLFLSSLHTMLGGIGNSDQIVIDLFRGNTVQWDCISIVMPSESTKVPAHTEDNIS